MERHSSDTPSLREIISQATFPQQASLRGPTAAVSFVDATQMTLFSGRVKELQDKCVLIAAKEQFNAALALIELDGFASRIVICPPDFTVDQLASVIASAKVDAILCDAGTKRRSSQRACLRYRHSHSFDARAGAARNDGMGSADIRHDRRREARRP